MARVNKATRPCWVGGGGWQAELQGKFEKTTSYALFPTKSRLSISEDEGILEKARGEKAPPHPPGGRNLSHRCMPGSPPPPPGPAHLARTQPASRLPSELPEQGEQAGTCEMQPGWVSASALSSLMGRQAGSRQAASGDWLRLGCMRSGHGEGQICFSHQTLSLPAGASDSPRRGDSRRLALVGQGCAEHR